MNNKNVANRVVYTATDHSHPRRDIMFAIADFASGERLTKDKQGPNNQALANIINAAMVWRDFQSQLPLEIQIFGTVDITKHVQKIYMAPGTSDVVQQNIKCFSKRFGVPYEKIKVPKNANPIIKSGAQVNTIEQEMANL